MRRTRCLHALVVLFVLGAAALAHAQPAVQLDSYRSTELATDHFAVSRPGAPGHLRVHAQLVTDYGHRPLYVKVPDYPGYRNVAVVQHQLVLNAVVALGLFDRFTVFGGLPVNVVMASGGTQDVLPKADPPLPSDPFFGGRAVIFGNDRGALAAQLTGTLPLADAVHADQRYSGEIGGTLVPELLGEVQLPWHLSWTTQAGVRVRMRNDAEIVPSLPISHELLWGTAFLLPILPARDALSGPVLAAHVEAYGRHSVSDPTNGNTTGIEALVGAKARPGYDLLAGLAVGTGIVRGYGVPDARIVASLGWAPPKPAPRAPKPKPAPAAPPPPPEPAVAVAAAPEPAPAPAPEPAPEPPPPPPPVVAEAPAPVVPAAPPTIDTLILFERKSDVLTSAAATQLEDIAKHIAALPASAVVQVEGHTDQSGTTERNLQLARARASIVRTWLVQHGVASARLETVACGEAYAPAEGAAGEAEARSVRFRVVEPSTPPRAGCVAR